MFKEIEPIINPPSTLIVVASLIEKVPNMGGLARTCLTIGVSGLVIPNLVSIKTSEFT